MSLPVWIEVLVPESIGPVEQRTDAHYELAGHAVDIEAARKLVPALRTSSVVITHDKAEEPPRVAKPRMSPT